MSADRIRNPSFKFPPEAPYIQKPDRRKSRHADRMGSGPLGAFSAGVIMGCLLMIGVALVAITQGWLS